MCHENKKGAIARKNCIIFSQCDSSFLLYKIRPIEKPCGQDAHKSVWKMYFVPNLTRQTPIYCYARIMDFIFVKSPSIIV